MIRACLFDMGNVLFHFSHDRMCAQMGSLCGWSGAEVRRLLFDADMLCEFERGRLSEEAFHRKFETAVGRAVDFEGLRFAGSDIFQLNESIVPVIERLKRGGVRLVLLSNTSKPHFDFLNERYDLLGEFDDFVVSYEVGAMKPEPEIFEAALSRIGCEPGECFYTDDIPAYVAQGRAFGLQAEVYTDTPALVGHLEVRRAWAEG